MSLKTQNSKRLKRSLLLESLEIRALFSVDGFDLPVLPTESSANQFVSFQPKSSVNVGTSLGQRIQDPARSAQVAPATVAAFGANTILELSPNALNSEQAANVNFVAGLSKQTFAPTHFISSF